MLEDIIQHERREIHDLLTEFEQETYYEKELEKLRKIVMRWIENQISGEDIELKEIKKLLANLTKSTIRRSKLIRMENILDDISQNRKRVEQIIRQTNHVFTDGNTDQEERMKALKRLLTYKLISPEQYNNLEKNVDDLDMDSVISELKNVKIGRGIPFLPTVLQKLKDKAKDWIAEFAEKKSGHLRDKLLAVLDELLQRKAISKQEYKNKIEQNNIV